MSAETERLLAEVEQLLRRLLMAVEKNNIDAEPHRKKVEKLLEDLLRETKNK